VSTHGVDVSENQDATLPWPAWFAAGHRAAVARASIGFHTDSHFARYVAEAHAAGFIVGAYHAILGHQFYDPTLQAVDFLALITPEVAFLVLDIEAPGVSAADALAFVAYVTAHSALPLVLYGNWDLAAIVAAHPELRRFGVWWAGYPTFPKLTTAPPWPTPRNVPAGLQVIAWQYAGDNGRLPPYQGPIDLTEWYELPVVVATPPDLLAASIAGHAHAIKELL
jgi:GH25 family lysozyme M1 (1,4-beta-N-acetylmuramidase)